MIEEYGSPSFASFKYRPGISYTGFFGVEKLIANIDGKQVNRYRFHRGVDRGAGRIVCPFDAKGKIFKDDVYGVVLELTPVDKNLDFKLRICHLIYNELSQLVVIAISHSTIINQGEYIGIAGDSGYADGRHTHTEIVSIGPKSNFIEEIIDKHYQSENSEVFSREIGLKDDEVKQLENDIRNKGIIRIFKKKCISKDWNGGNVVTFYDTTLLNL